MEHPTCEAESLQRFRSQFECCIRSLESENLSLEELYTILLYTRLPSSLSETIKRACGDDWLDLDAFKKGLETEIHNIRAFPTNKVEVSKMKGTVSTFAVEQGQGQDWRSKGSVRPKYRGCALCEGTHLWIYCKMFHSREENLSKLKHLGL